MVVITVILFEKKTEHYVKIEEAGRSKLNKTDTLLAPETAAPVLTSFEKTRKS